MTPFGTAIPNAPKPCWTQAHERICWPGTVSCLSISQCRNWAPIIPSLANCRRGRRIGMRKALVFAYLTGISRPMFSNPVLLGSWDAAGHYSGQWSEKRMDGISGPDGCPSFIATQEIESDDLNQ